MVIAGECKLQGGDAKIFKFLGFFGSCNSFTVVFSGIPNSKNCFLLQVSRLTQHFQEQKAMYWSNEKIHW